MACGRREPPFFMNWWKWQRRGEPPQLGDQLGELGDRPADSVSPRSGDTPLHTSPTQHLRNFVCVAATDFLRVGLGLIEY